MSLNFGPNFKSLVREDELMGYGGFISHLHRLESRLRALMMAMMAMKAGVKYKEKDPIMAAFDQQALAWDELLVTQYRKAVAVLVNSAAMNTPYDDAHDLVNVQWSRFEELEIDGQPDDCWEWLCHTLPNYFEYLSGNRQHVPKWEIWPLGHGAEQEES